MEARSRSKSLHFGQSLSSWCCFLPSFRGQGGAVWRNPEKNNTTSSDFGQNEDFWRKIELPSTCAGKQWTLNLKYVALKCFNNNQKYVRQALLERPVSMLRAFVLSWKWLLWEADGSQVTQTGTKGVRAGVCLLQLLPPLSLLS